MRENETKSRGLAKNLRRSMTRAEVILWSRLRRDMLDEHRFRRQHPIGPYVADFACVPAMLVVEVDGATHGTEAEVAHDRARDAYMRKLGWRVYRVWNEDVYKNSDGVLRAICALLSEKVPPPFRSPGFKSGGAQHLPRKRVRRNENAKRDRKPSD